DPVGNNHALVKVRARHAWSALDFPQADGVYSACIIDLTRQERRSDFWRPGCEVIELDAIEIRQTLVPVVWISLHDPDLFIDTLFMPKWTSTWTIHHLTQVVVVVLQCLLAHDDVPATGKRPEHEILRACLAQFKLDSVGITHVDLAHSRKERRAWTTEASGRRDETGVRGLDILRGKITTVVELHALT